MGRGHREGTSGSESMLSNGRSRLDYTTWIGDYPGRDRTAIQAKPGSSGSRVASCPAGDETT